MEAIIFLTVLPQRRGQDSETTFMQECECPDCVRPRPIFGSPQEQWFLAIGILSKDSAT
jgi:hypothetical protein